MNKGVNMTFGEEIKYVRKSLYLSQAEMGQKLNVTENTVRRWENSKSNPRDSAKRRFYALCKKEKIKIPDLINDNFL